jgi:hypothetical protein
MNAAAEHLGVSSATIRKLVAAGVLPKQQVAPWAPWEIQRADLDTDAVKGLVARLRSTGKLHLEGVGSDSQLKLLE